MQAMSALGARWWNDSCDLKELSHAVELGAVGATSNPVIVKTVVEQDAERWLPEIAKIARDNPSDIEDEIAWKLIEEIGRQASKILLPAFESSEGLEGYLSLQVNPKFHTSAQKMLEHARQLASLGPNIAIKAPCTAAGLQAIEAMTAEGIRVNVTVSFCVSQAVASAEAIERGMAKAAAKGLLHKNAQPYVTLMEGRVDDAIKREKQQMDIQCEEAALEWGGVAAFKKAARLFRQRGYRSVLLAAAYRNQLQWSEIIGRDVLQSIPYGWWTQYNKSGHEPKLTVEEPVEDSILATLQRFENFRLAYEEDSMLPEQFVRYDGSIHTLKQFAEGYHQLLKIVRGVMLDPSGL